ncbi:MAG: hypothetical protein GXY34_10950 [Syntrophomonadaceae bacterium]|nr:hypothetical protein [Syntrophomonadaceae bacterium]
MKNSRYYPHERNRFFYGKLLTVRDFEAEQRYVNDKRRMINRLLHGAGVVCGLQVIAVDEKTISLETGMALDYSGREIVVSAPLTQKLSMIDGFTGSETAKNVYLCIAYDERGKEPVYSVASSSSHADEMAEYNRIQESYRVFLTETAPDETGLGFSNLTEDVVLLHESKDLRISQICPRYVNPEELFEIRLRVEKSVQLPRLQIEYQLSGDHIEPLDPQKGSHIIFSEPDENRLSRYEAAFTFKAGDQPGVVDNIVIPQGKLSVTIGDDVQEYNCDYAQVINIISEPVKDRILKNYLNIGLDQYAGFDPDQPIYLAQLSLLQIGSSFMIQQVTQVPFGEYAYNSSDLYKIGILGKGSRQAPFLTHAEANILESGEDPRLDVRFHPAENMFDFRLGIPRTTIIREDFSTGLVEIELEANTKAGKSYFSDEVEHGMGEGPVYIMTGVEESSDEELMKVPQHSEQIFFGAYEVFQKSAYESLAPRMAIGVVLYPTRGTFRIGVRCQTPVLTRVHIRWWAFRHK